jgi:hypothetical protein
MSKTTHSWPTKTGEGQFGRLYRAHNTRKHRQLCVLKLQLIKKNLAEYFIVFR